MLVHTITNRLAGWFLRRDWNCDDCGGFGHIDLGDFDYTKYFQVVERLVDVPNDTYYIRVVGAFDSLSKAYDEIDFRIDYCNNYAPGCYSEFELWQYQSCRYRWYYADDCFDSEELPDYMCSVLVLNEPEHSFSFDDPGEWGEYTSLLLSSGDYILVDVTVPKVEITYFDNLTEVLVPSYRPTKVIPCPTHVLMRN